MLSLFKTKAHPWVATQEKKTIEEMRGVKPKVKSITEKMIEEIHESFYTEVDKILADAKITKSLATTKQGLIDKRARLISLGFTNTKEVTEAQVEIDRLNELERENRVKQKLVRAIEYFSQNYPNYKFITPESVHKICAKYNLIYGTIDKYIGTVPDVNLKHIENFKVKDEDRLWLESDNIFGRSSAREVSFKVYKDKILREQKEAEAWDSMDYEMKRHMMQMSRHRSNYDYKKAPLEIVAPLKDFNTKDMKLDGFKLSKIEIPDPVVIQPVMFEDTKYYLVVTAWGLEAGDSEIVNARHN